MFKNEKVGEEILEEMLNNLRLNACEQKTIKLNRRIDALNLLNKAATNLENAGLYKEAEAIVRTMEIAAEEKLPSVKQQVQYLKDYGMPLKPTDTQKASKVTGRRKVAQSGTVGRYGKPSHGPGSVPSLNTATEPELDQGWGVAGQEPPLPSLEKQRIFETKINQLKFVLQSNRINAKIWEYAGHINRHIREFSTGRGQKTDGGFPEFGFGVGIYLTEFTDMGVLNSQASVIKAVNRVFSDFDGDVGWFVNWNPEAYNGRFGTLKRVLKTTSSKVTDPQTLTLNVG